MQERIMMLDPTDKWDEPSYGTYFTSKYGHIGFDLLRHLGCPQCGYVMILKSKSIVLGDQLTIDGAVTCPKCRTHFYVKESKVIPTWIVNGGEQIG